MYKWACNIIYRTSHVHFLVSSTNEQNVQIDHTFSWCNYLYKKPEEIWAKLKDKKLPAILQDVKGQVILKRLLKFYIHVEGLGFDWGFYFNLCFWYSFDYEGSKVGVKDYVWLLETMDSIYMVGKNGHFGKVIAGKFNHSEGNFDFWDKEIHKK